MPSVVDARGITVSLPAPPRRVVSLVPSTTETLFDLGLGDRVVGVTRFCVHPADRLTGMPRVGGTKDVDPARVAALAPDLILGNCEENTREIFSALQDVAPLYAAFPRTVDDALADLLSVGSLVDAGPVAQIWHATIRAARADLHAAVAALPLARVAWLIWRDPWMAVGPDTFIASMLAEAGLTVVPDGSDRFPTFTPDALAAWAPDHVLLSSEPFPFRARHAAELAAATGLPRTAFLGADGEAVSWHGTRMATGLRALARWRRGDWPELP